MPLFVCFHVCFDHNFSGEVWPLCRHRLPFHGFQRWPLLRLRQDGPWAQRAMAPLRRRRRSRRGVARSVAGGALHAALRSHHRRSAAGHRFCGSEDGQIVKFERTNGLDPVKIKWLTDKAQEQRVFQEEKHQMEAHRKAEAGLFGLFGWHPHQNCSEWMMQTIARWT